MKKFAKKFVLMAMVAGISTALLAGCGSNNNSGGTTTPVADGGSKTEAPASTSKYTTVVAGSGEFNQVFSPFFGTTAYDRYVYSYTQAALLGSDRNAEPVPGIADFAVEEIKNAEGKVEKSIYTFTLKDGITFSDGEAVTADDIIFTYKVLSDPNYDGSSTFFVLPIVGMKEYRYDDPNYAAKVAEIKTESEAISNADVEAYILTAAAADYDKHGADTLIDYVGGVDGLDGLDDAAKKEKVVAAYAAFETEKYFDDYKADAISAKYKELEKAYIASNLAGAEPKVTEIEGIKKIDDKTVEVTLEGVDPTALLKLGILLHQNIIME
jgi:peptide/nickel transport system substrate-binding protein